MENAEYSNLRKLIESSRWIGWPRYFTMDEYMSVLDNFVKVITRTERVESIYQVGSIGVPGLSDIDLFLILKNRVDFTERYSINQLSDKDQYIFSHECWLVNKAIMQDIAFWFPAFSMKHIYGEPIKLKSIRSDEKSLVDCLLLCNFLVTKVPLDFLIYSVLKGEFHVRIMLAMVNSLNHTLSLYHSAWGVNSLKDEQVFQKSFSNFRKQWFSLGIRDQREHLTNFVVTAVKLSLDVISKTAFNITEKIMFPEHNEIERFSYITKGRIIEFRSLWEPESILSEILLKNNNSIRELWCALPIELGYYLTCFGNSNGLIGAQVKKSLRPSLGQQSVYCNAKIFELHCKVLEKYARFSTMWLGRASQGYHSFWLHYSPNKLQRIIRKLILCQISLFKV